VKLNCVFTITQCSGNNVTVTSEHEQICQFRNCSPKPTYMLISRQCHHRLNDSSSPVLTATPHSYGKGQNSIPYKIKTPERIAIKFGTVDYVLDISPQNKFGEDWSSGGFWVNMSNIRCLLLSLFFSPNGPGGHTPNQFSRGILQTTWMHV